MANADGLVLPKPGIPKTLGILNVIFGILLVLMGGFALAMTLAAPLLFKGLEKVAKEAQATVEAKQKADMKGYDDRIAAAKDEEEKKSIEQEKANAEAVQPRMNPVDLSAATDALNDPTMKTVNTAGLLSGLILHIGLLIAGIGLIRLIPWGRTLSLWWAGLQIVQVLALLAANIIYVLPINQAITEKQIAKLEAAAKQKGGGQAEASVAQMTKVMSSLALPMTVASSMTGLVYPIVLLIMLNGVGARAALFDGKSRNIEIEDL